MYLLLCGTLPFDSDSKTEIFEKTVKAKLDFEDDIWKLMSDDAKEIVGGLLSWNPKDRPNLGAILNHKWFQKHVTVNSIADKINMLEPDPEQSYDLRR